MPESMSAIRSSYYTSDGRPKKKIDFGSVVDVHINIYISCQRLLVELKLNQNSLWPVANEMLHSVHTIFSIFIRILLLFTEDTTTQDIVQCFTCVRCIALIRHSLTALPKKWMRIHCVRFGIQRSICK